MPRPRRGDTGTASVLTDTAWHSIGAGSVPVGPRGCQATEIGKSSVNLGMNSGRIGHLVFQPCARLVHSGTLLELMHRVNGNGKLISAFIAPFAPPTR